MMTLMDILVAPTCVKSPMSAVEHEILTEATEYDLPYDLPQRWPRFQIKSMNYVFFVWSK